MEINIKTILATNHHDLQYFTDYSLNNDQIKQIMHTCAIIIPLYNKKNQIERTLHSVLQQRFSFTQVIVVNDCSTDDSASVVEQFIANHPDTNIQLIQHKYNGGPSAARNTGLQALLCDYVCFLDADDYLSPTASEDINRILSTRESSLGIVIYGVKEQGSGAIRPSFHRLRQLALCQTYGNQLLKLNDWASTMVKEPLFCSGGNVLLSRRLTTLRFDPTLRNFEDWDFYFRSCCEATLLGLDIIVSNHIGLIYTEEDNLSLSRTPTISASLRNPPPFITNKTIPIQVRRFTTGIWLCHVAQRSGFREGVQLIRKALFETEDATPMPKHIAAAVLGLLIGHKGWARISNIRKKLRHV